VTQFSQYLLETLEVREIVQFDADALLDYRARRPTMYFDQDHLTDYRPAKLSLYLAKDEMGQQFLLLTGFEPDFQWERFTQAVLQLVQRYEVKDTTWVHAIPMPTPHTGRSGSRSAATAPTSSTRCRSGARTPRCRRTRCTFSSTASPRRATRPPGSCS
jgi:hypothetical protein